MATWGILATSSMNTTTITLKLSLVTSTLIQLYLHIPLDEIAAEENISMKSLVACIDYLKEQRVNIDTNFYNSDNLNFYSCSANLEKSFDEF